jgi:hypothetical protein
VSNSPKKWEIMVYGDQEAKDMEISVPVQKTTELAMLNMSVSRTAMNQSSLIQPIVNHNITKV